MIIWKVETTLLFKTSSTTSEKFFAHESHGLIYYNNMLKKHGEGGSAIIGITPINVIVESGN
jgi:hypothetical protein